MKVKNNKKQNLPATIKEGISRRNVLIGAGTVAISLPWLEEKGFSQEAGKRLTTVFFGNGVLPEWTEAGLIGYLSPLAQMREKVCLIKGVGVLANNGRGRGGFHNDGSASFGTGIRTTNEGAIGPSIDYFAYSKLRPNTSKDVISAGVFERVQDKIRYIKSWRSPGSAVEPYRTPLQFFTEVFGTLLDNSGNQVTSGPRYELSILDSIIEHYQHVTSERAGFSAQSKEKIKEHLDRIRELEKKVIATEQALQEAEQNPSNNPTPKTPSESLDAFIASLDKNGWNWPYQIPNIPSALETKTGEYGDQNKNIVQASEYDWVWPVMAEIYAMAQRTNKAHFGSMICFGGGDRTKHGQYKSDWAHEYYHRNDLPKMGYYVQEIMTYITFFLKALDNPNYLEPNGKTILDNSMVVIGSELSRQHYLTEMFYAVAGGMGKIKVGQDLKFTERTDVDLYNSVLHAMGIDMGEPTSSDKKIGDKNRFTSFLDIFS